MEFDDGEILRVAKAIEGPHLPVPDDSPYTLDDLRDQNWRHLTTSEQHARLNEAASVLRLLKPDESDLNARMKAAGMFSLTELLAGTPIDLFRAHQGISTFAHFEEWVAMKRRQFETMRARYLVGEKSQDDELYEWVFAHAAVFGDIDVNLRALKARQQTDAGDIR